MMMVMMMMIMMMMDDWCCESFSGGIDRFQLGMFPGLVCLFDLILYVHSTIFQLCGMVLPGLNQY